MKSARQELVEVQNRLVRRIKREIAESIGPLTPELSRYKREYEREFSRYHLSDRAELVEELLRSDIVFVADYHTLKHSQLTLVTMLEELVKAGRQVVLCLEAVRADQQEILDAFMRGDLKEDKFLKLIDYEKSWGFPWNQYKPIFDFARQHGIRLAGINSIAHAGRGGLRERDRFAGEIVAEEVLANPDAVVVVHDGDLHIARRHLPREVARVLGRGEKKRRVLLIFQNSERIYRKLAQARNEDRDVVRLGRDAFCVMSATPLVKFQSYLNWEANREELTPVITSDWLLSGRKSLDYADQVHEIIHTIARFFGISGAKLDDFQLYTTGDLDFFRRLREERLYSEQEIQDITIQILKGESYFITKGHVIYLGNLSLSHAAEEATHFINHQCGGEPEGAMTPAQAFYYRVMREAVGWLGSKVINPKRVCFKEQDYVNFLAESAGKKLAPKLKETRRICRYVIQHRKMEQRLFKRRGRRRARPSPTLRKIYSLPMSLHLGVAHALGYMLGEKFYHALLARAVSKDEMRALIYEKYRRPNRPFEIYLDYSARMEETKDRCYSKDVCL